MIGHHDVKGQLDGAGGDERALIEHLRDGDAAAYESLVREHSERLLSTARRLLGSEAEASDAVQETFFAAFKAMHTFDGDARLSTWLHRITVNVCLMKLRSSRRRPEDLMEDLLPDFDDDGGWAEPENAWGTSVERQIYDAELRSIVRRCCDALPEAYRRVLMMRLVEGLDTGEVAVHLGISANAVKIRLHRARQALCTLLRETLGDRSPELAMLGASAESGEELPALVG